MECNKSTTLLGALILSLGIFAAGFSVGKAFYYSKMLNRSVTVKGLAERDVKSDLGIWQLHYHEISGNIIDANKKLLADQNLVLAFLKQNGFTDTEVSIQPVKVEDRLANVYNQTGSSPADANTRYVMTGGVQVRSNRVEVIARASALTNSLLQQGIPLTLNTDDANPNPSYYFTGLDAIRPGMMSDATRSALTVANQFAKDADLDLKGIQHASQGVFQIMSADTSTMSADWNSSQSALSSINKKIRLVTTIDYRIK